MTNIYEIPASSLQVLLLAEKNNVQLGHENLGYLSLSNGFMPKSEPLKTLPPAFQLWDEICESTPELIKDLSFRSTLDQLPILSTTEDVLPDKYLKRASILLGFFAHAYVNCAGDLLSQADVPDSIMAPWKEVSSRLHRPEPFLSYFDLIAYNWQFKSKDMTERKLENMELLYPIFNCQEERNLYLIQTEMMACASPMVRAAAEAQEATLLNDHDLLSKSLDTMISCVRHIANVSFAKLAYNKRSNSHMDPVVFTKTMMSFAVPIKEGIPGPSGTSFPYAHLLDEFIGRKKYDEGISKEALKIRELYPPNVRRFLNAISNISVADYIQEKGSEILIKKYTELMEAYSGEDGFLNTHRKRVYSFIQTSFKVGRPQTIGGFEGKNEDEWATVNSALQNMNNERPKCPFASRSSTNKKQRTRPEKKNNPDGGNKYSLSEIATHSTEKEGYWVIMDNKVLDISPYVKKHPGGETALLEFVGSDISKEFSRIHEDSLVANKLVEKFCIGELEKRNFSEKKITLFWEAQKELLLGIIEQYNIYCLEISVHGKEYFPNQNKNHDSPYEKFLQEHSSTRLRTTYLEKLEKHSSKINSWLDQYRPEWRKECPFGKFSRRAKRLSTLLGRDEKIHKDYHLEFLSVKNKAIRLSQSVEQIESEATEVPHEIRPELMDLLKSIRSLGKVTKLEKIKIASQTKK